MNLPARYRVDLACAVGLSLFAAALAPLVNEQIRRSGSHPTFYQEEFAPAVMFACGNGFRNVDWVNRDPALAAFLFQGRDRVGCGELAKTPMVVPRDGFQRISLYLELAVGLTWRVAGVSWSAVTWLNALLAGFLAATLYGVLRLGMRPLIAAILSGIIVTSPLHLTYLPELRDYSKAPFLLALVLLMGVAVKWPLSRRRLLWLAGIGGIVGGVGFGFRTDILLMVAPFLAVLLVFRAGSPKRRSRVIDGATASAIFIGSFALAAAPMLRERDGNLGHVILLGFGSPFNSALGVEAKHYELSARYHDVFQATVVRSYAERVDEAKSFSGTSEEYSRQSSRYLMTVIRTFPADAAIRAVMAVVQILAAPFSPAYARASHLVRGGPVGRIYERRADALDRVRWLGWLASAAVIAGIAAWRMRWAVFLLCLVVFLGGGAAIQFHPRHFFYLEFMSWWAVGAMLDRAPAAGRASAQVIRDKRWRSRQWLARAGARVTRSAVLILVCAVATTVVLSATRRYQQQGMNRLFERALSSAGPPLNVTSVPTAADRVTLTPDLPELRLSGASRSIASVGTAYLLLDVDPDRCDSLSFLAIAQYKTLPGNDATGLATASLTDPRPGSFVKMLLPVYSTLDTDVAPVSFGGIELARADASCIAAIRRVGDLGSLPLLVTAILGPDWRTASHYQTMAGVETREDGTPFHTRLYPTLPTLEIGRSAILQAATNPWPGAIFAPRVTAPAGSGMVVDGTPETSSAYLLQYPERAISRGTCAVAGGELTAGGLTFGMLRNGQWYQQVNIVERGRFVAAGCALEDGNYAIVLANDNPAGGVTRARLEKIGWAGVGPQVLHTFPTELATMAAQFVRTKAVLQQTDFTFEASLARADPSGWTINGRADGPLSYLLVSKPQRVTDGSVLAVQGSITRGGLAVGLLRDGRWAAQVNVTNLGPFTVLIQPPGGGTYDVIVANNLADPSRETAVAISRIAWITR